MSPWNRSVAEKSSRVLIWGGGGHGSAVADLVRSLGHSLAGFVDRDPAKIGRVVEPGGSRVVMSEEQLRESLQAQGGLPRNVDALALGVGDNAVREQCFRALDSVPVPPLVHPSAIVSASAVLGRGTVVFPGAIVNAAAVIGSAVIVNSGAIVEHDCAVDDVVHISPGAVLGGGVRVGARSWIGLGASVIQGVAIGVDAIIGAGSVIIRDVPAHCTVVGNPGRLLSQGSGVERADQE
jgi:sugar O-acyltransferase (sialic acid O-acetyltransferase NeuD family)